MTKYDLAGTPIPDNEPDFPADENGRLTEEMDAAWGAYLESRPQVYNCTRLGTDNLEENRRRAKLFPGAVRVKPPTDGA
jgi:hypothetical protein